MGIGRPKKIKIGAGDGNLILLMEIFSKKFFKGDPQFDVDLDHHPYLNQARYITNIAYETYKVRLVESEMKKNVFQPFGEGKEVTLSKNYLIKICSFLKLAAEDYGFQDSMNIIETFESAYSDNRQTEIEDDELPFEGSLKEKISGLLTGSDWWIYERIGKAHIRNEDFGIAIGQLNFTLISGKLKATMSFMYKNTKRSYTGDVTFDHKPDYIYMDLLLKDSGKRAFVAFTLSDSDNMDQTLMLGHFMYYSKEYHHLLTKAVVLQKENDSTNKHVIGDYAFGSAGYKAINEEITKFLYPRDKNRLSLPRDIVSTEDELGVFMDKKAKKVNPVLQKHFQGRFKVYYKKIDGVIFEDELSIQLNTNLSIIEATYIHRPDVSKKNNKRWKGSTYLNAKFVILELSEIQNDLKVPDEDPILLTFYTSEEDLSYNDCECFPGLLTGLQDTKRAPVSYICLVVRADVMGFDGVKDERLANFFLTTPTMLTPAIFPFKLDDL